MSIHKLTAGSGYDYLTRQVAALDATEKGHLGLASYYTERGETPGVWMGSGIAGIDGLTPGDVVTAEQMQALFGAGLHPLAEQRQRQLQGPDLTERDYTDVTRLGAPFKVYEPDVSPFRVEVAKRIAALNQAAGLPGDWPVPATERARIRTEVGREFFTAEHGRPPEDARELAAAIAQHSRPRTQAVAGYDLTFSPVKSVSALWAVAGLPVAAAIERAHQAAIRDALTFIEHHALYTRTGANGVRQVDVQGMVATAFTHRDSRAGDPDLHTHVAVANKVQTLDGRWLSIDGRVLFKATVAASETYNTALETHLRAGLGLDGPCRWGKDHRLSSVDRRVWARNPAVRGLNMVASLFVSCGPFWAAGLLLIEQYSNRTRNSGLGSPTNDPNRTARLPSRSPSAASAAGRSCSTCLNSCLTGANTRFPPQIGVDQRV